jgi:hypothetical protein
MKITHDIKTALWCGPAAISAVTGRPTSEIMALARHFTGKKTVKGLSVRALRQVLNALGYRTDEIFSAGLEFCAGNPNWKPTLAKWTKENAKAFSKLPCVVLVSNHYVTVKGRQLVDTFTPGFEPVPLKKAPWRRARVAKVLRVEKTEGPVFVPPPPFKPVVETAGRGAVLRLARQYNIEVDDQQKEFDQIWIYPPPALTDGALDRFDGDHCVFDWADAMQRVKGYISDLK